MNKSLATHCLALVLAVSACSSGGTSGKLPGADGWDPGTAVSNVAPPGVNIPWIGPVLTIGDSITWGPEFCPMSGTTSSGGPCAPGAEYSNGGYRKHLYELAQADGIHLEMVGTLDAGPDSMPQRATDGHSGAVIGCFNPDGGDPYAGSGRYEMCAHLDEILSDFPDAALGLVNLGMNEILHNTEATAADRLAEMVAHILEQNQSILIAVLLPHVPCGNQADTDNMKTLRADYLATFTEFSKRVAIIDAGGGLTCADLFDDVHPTPHGSATMAEAIWAAVKRLKVS